MGVEEMVAGIVDGGWGDVTNTNMSVQRMVAAMSGLPQVRNI